MNVVMHGPSGSRCYSIEEKAKWVAKHDPGLRIERPRGRSPTKKGWWRPVNSISIRGESSGLNLGQDSKPNVECLIEEEEKKMMEKGEEIGMEASIQELELSIGESSPPILSKALVEVVDSEVEEVESVDLANNKLVMLIAEEEIQALASGRLLIARECCH